MSNKLRKNTLCLLAVIVVLSFSVNALAQEDEQQRDQRRPRARRKMDDGPPMHERMLERIAQDDPEKAEELRKLIEEDPEEFRKQMHEYMQEKSGQRDQPRRSRSQRPQDQRGGGMMGSGRPQEHGKGQQGKGGQGRKSHWRERIQKQHEEFVQWLGDNYPKVAENLEKLKDKDPVEYMKKAGEKLKKYGEIMEAEQKNPEYAKVLKEDMMLKQARDKIIRTYKNAKPKQKKQLKAELKEIVAERFDIVIQKKEFKYKALKERLVKMQKQVATRQAELDKLVQSKDAAIAERMNELVGESEKLNWD